MQQAGLLDKAAARFKAAKEFDPDNIVADVNLTANGMIRSGSPLPAFPDLIAASMARRFSRARTDRPVPGIPRSSRGKVRVGG